MGSSPMAVSDSGRAGGGVVTEYSSQPEYLRLLYPVTNARKPSRGRRCALDRATLCVSAVFAVYRCLFVCPSVFLSVTLVDCIHTAEDIIKLLVQPGSPIILVFLPLAPIPNY